MAAEATDPVIEVINGDEEDVGLLGGFSLCGGTTVDQGEGRCDEDEMVFEIHRIDWFRELPDCILLVDLLPFLFWLHLEPFFLEPGVELLADLC